MNLKALKGLPCLYPTDEMKKIAEGDIPVRQRTYSGYYDEYKYDIHMRCCEENEIVKAAFYLTRDIRMGCMKPVYEVFLDRKSRNFITWDTICEKWRQSKLDYLTWPGYRMKVFESQKDRELVKCALGVEKEGYRGILEFQRKVRAEQLEKRHRKETDPWDETLKQIPDVPKDWQRWVDKHGICQHYIFYEYSKRKEQTGYCSWCEQQVPIMKPRHNQFGKCRRCGHKVQYKAVGRAGRFATRQHFVYLIQRCQDGFVVRMFTARRWYQKGNYKNPEVSCSEERRVIYDQSLQSTAFYYGLYKNTTYRWIKGEALKGFYYPNYFRNYLGVVYKRTLAGLSKKELKTTGIYQLVMENQDIDPEAYLAALKKAPYLEKLAKSGLGTLANDIWLRGKTLNVQENSDLAKALGIDHGRMGRLRKMKGGIGILTWLQYEKQTGKVLSDTTIQYFADFEILPSNLMFILDRMSVERIKNYLKKQYELSKRAPKALLSTWEDYLSMSQRLQRLVNKEVIYRPKNLLEAHDEVVALCEEKKLTLKAAEIAKMYPEVDDNCQAIAEKYGFKDKNYQIVIPESIEDILKDGQALRHCTRYEYRYYDRIQRKETYIVFLRKAAQPEKPFYTLEIEPDGTVRQKRTTGDTQDKEYDKAVGFIRKWQRDIQKRLTDEDRRLAKISARLRTEELKELRKDKVKVWHGCLAGKLLADVLEGDLMEAALCAETDFEETVVENMQQLQTAA